MAIDRQGTGLAITRVCIGVFFLAEGLSKYRWFTDSSILAGMLTGWAQNAAPGSASARYLEHFALPGVVYFARLVPIESRSLSEEARSNRVPPLPTRSLGEAGVLAIESQIIEIETEAVASNNWSAGVDAPEQLGAVRDIVEDA